MRNHRTALVVAALALTVLCVRHPSANFQLLTHDASDPAPHRFQAAVDTGLMAVSILVTWTSRHLASPN